MLYRYHALLLCLALCLDAAAQAVPRPTSLDQVDGPAPLRPIVLTLFLHDQLTRQEVSDLNDGYLGWFIKEVTDITGRRVNVLSITGQPGYTDFGYRLGDGIQTLQAWKEHVLDYVDRHNLPRPGRYHKYVLVTRHRLTSDILGISFSTQGVAIASLRSWSTIAHEVGHTLGALHENAQTRYTPGLPCQTLMAPTESLILPSCYVFSDSNREAIKAYLDKP
ncbi:reprolysin-like metallopeptidase [Pseudomonas ovata]|uniref:reprolysin-like metallopeptidase n=1 Tax=Pseudomonas ovata TaxID=1839709 RepID=UPI000D68B8E4|nr:hypothetical protein [Pseudomonas ovata]